MLTKHVVLVAGGGDVASEEDRAPLLAGHATLADAPGVRGLIVNLVVGDAGGEADPIRWGDAPPLRAATELWTDPGAFEGLADGFDRRHAYRVDPRVQKSRPRTWPIGERSPGIKNLFLVRRAASLDAEGFRRGWLDRHVPLALRHHVGMCAYVTDVVLDVPDGAAALDGIAQLHFASERDLEEGMYDDDAGRAAIEADVIGFLAAAAGVRVHEYVLVEPPADSTLSTKEGRL